MALSADEGMDLLTRAGHLSEEEIRREAFFALLRERPDLRLTLAVERYKQGGITLNRGAEIAGRSTEEFKQALADQGVEIRRGHPDEGEQEDQARSLGRDE